MVARLVWLADAPFPALRADRTKLTLLELLTSTAMLELPFPDASRPVALCEVKPMSSICTRPLTLVIVSAGLPVVEVDVTVALPPA
jgi:hypothetical protein